MMSSTVLWILLAVTIAAGVSFYQYLYKQSLHSKQQWFFAGLRFGVVFLVLLLLINPQIQRKAYRIEKPTLTVLVDNSRSIAFLNQEDEVRNVVKRFRESEGLNDKFDISFYAFSSDLEPLDSLNFKGKNTDISQVLKTANQLQTGPSNTFLLITDGNQTSGRHYKYIEKNIKRPIFPIVLGDTTEVRDLRIDLVNVNRYAYHKNEFPLEIFVNYNGKSVITSRLRVLQNGNTLWSQSLTFSQENQTEVVSLSLTASSLGVQSYQITIDGLPAEKNTQNNTKNIAIEVIDQRAKILVISAITHPDLGMLKKSIESNELREVVLKKPSENLGDLDQYNGFVIYQPDTSFREVIDRLNDQSKNIFYITGEHTDWRYFNDVQFVVTQEITGQTEEVQPIVNTTFSSFLLPNLQFLKYPPVRTSFGEVLLTGNYDVALTQKVGTIDTQIPLLLTADTNEQRFVYFLGEGLWQWRSESYLQSGSFENFDGFFNGFIQYIISNQRKERLSLDYQSFYYGATDLVLNAQYVDKNYEFDSRAALTIALENTETGSTYSAPLLVKDNTFEVNLSNLGAGTYRFTVRVAGEDLVKRGSFTIVPYDIEGQFTRPNYEDLKQLAINTGGVPILSKDFQKVISQLLDENRFQPIQKEEFKTVSLIDWYWLLFGIILLLTLEWFFRKYRGLI